MAGNIKLMSTKSSSSMSSSSSTFATTAAGSGSGSGSATMILSGSVNSTSTGTINKKPRRLWTLHDRSAVSVNLLKANLAQDGCEEAQLNVAKKLLSDESNEPTATKNENCRLAIYWLVKSSEQGNEEATDLLRKCLESSRGINYQNIIDVQTNLETPRNDKLTIKAARLLYEKLSNGEEFITTAQLEARLAQLQESRNVSFAVQDFREPSPKPAQEPGDSGNASPTSTPSPSNSSDKNTQKTQEQSDSVPRRERRRTWTINSDDGSEAPIRRFRGNGCKLVADDLVRNAIRYNHGDIPSILISYSNTFGKKFHRWNLKSYGTFSLIQFIILALIWVNVEFNLHLALFVGVLILCFWSVYNLLGWQWSQSHFSDWTVLYKSVLREEYWSETLPTYRLYKKYCRPYLITNLVCVTILLIYGFNPDIDYFHWFMIFIGIVTMFSISFTFGFRNNQNQLSLEFTIFAAMLILLPLIVSVISPDFIKELLTYYAKANLIPENNAATATGWKVYYLQDISSLYELVVKYTNQALWLLKGFLVTKIVLNGIGLAKDNLGKAFSEINLVLWIYRIKFSLTALEIDNNIMEGTGFFKLTTLLLLIFVVIVFYFNYSSLIYKIVTGIGIIFVISTFLLISLNMVFKIDLMGFSNITIGNGLSLGNFTSLFDSPLLLVQPRFNNKLLTWEEYDTNCHESAWNENNLGFTQMTCPDKYQNRRIHWNGTVALVQLRNGLQQQKNTEKNLLIFEILVSIKSTEERKFTTISSRGSWRNYIPFPINRFLSFNENSFNSQATTATISVLITTTKDNNNELYIKIVNQLLKIHSGDEIEFIGKLGNNIGGVVPEIYSEKIQCIKCQVADYGELDFVGSRKSGLGLGFNCPFKCIAKYFDILINQVGRIWEYLCYLYRKVLEKFRFGSGSFEMEDSI